MAELHADELFRRYSARVANWCWRFTGNRDAALDLSQDVLMRAYSHLGSFRSDAKFSTWMYTITRNHCFNHVRQKATEPMGDAHSLDLDPMDTREWDTLATLERESAIRLARQLVRETLNEREAQVMMLHYVEEIPIDAITRLLKLPNASGAKALIVSAKRKLSAASRRFRAQQARRAD